MSVDRRRALRFRRANRSSREGREDCAVRVERGCECFVRNESKNDEERCLEACPCRSMPGKGLTAEDISKSRVNSEVYALCLSEGETSDGHIEGGASRHSCRGMTVSRWLQRGRERSEEDRKECSGEPSGTAKPKGTHHSRDLKKNDHELDELHESGPLGRAIPWTFKSASFIPEWCNNLLQLLNSLSIKFRKKIDSGAFLNPVD